MHESDTLHVWRGDLIVRRVTAEVIVELPAARLEAWYMRKS